MLIVAVIYGTQNFRVHFLLAFSFRIKTVRIPHMDSNWTTHVFLLRSAHSASAISFHIFDRSDTLLTHSNGKYNLFSLKFK